MNWLRYANDVIEYASKHEDPSVAQAEFYKSVGGVFRQLGWFSVFAVPGGFILGSLGFTTFGFVGLVFGHYKVKYDSVWKAYRGLSKEEKIKLGKKIAAAVTINGSAAFYNWYALGSNQILLRRMVLAATNFVEAGVQALIG